MATHAKAVVIGGSAGALDALSAILPTLPANYPLAILAVVHLPPDKPSMLAGLLNQKCQIEVREAQDKEKIEQGVVYLAPPNYHLLVEPNRHVSLSGDETVIYSRPSIDVLFESAADVYRDGLIGIILTGASHDGAQGAQAICAFGGTVLVQDPNLAYAAVMPHAALKACPQAQKLSLQQIADTLQKAAFE